MINSLDWFNRFNCYTLEWSMSDIAASKFPQVAVDLDCKEQDVLNILNFIHKTCKWPHLKTPLTSVKRKLTFYDLKCEFYRCCGGGVVLCRHKYKHSQHTVGLRHCSLATSLTICGLMSLLNIRNISWRNIMIKHTSEFYLYLDFMHVLY